MGDHAVFAHHIFQRHLRHAALAAAEDGFAPQILPGKILRLPAHDEGAVALRQLGKHPGRVPAPLQQHIDARLGPGQADIHLAGEHAGHHLIRAAAVHQVDFQSLIGKKAQRHGRVLRGVEHRVRHLADAHPNGFFGQRGHGGAQQAQSKQQDHSLSHADTPKCFFSAFSRKSTP